MTDAAERFSGHFSLGEFLAPDSAERHDTQKTQREIGFVGTYTRKQYGRRPLARARAA